MILCELTRVLARFDWANPASAPVAADLHPVGVDRPQPHHLTRPRDHRLPNESVAPQGQVRRDDTPQVDAGHLLIRLIPQQHRRRR